MSVDDCVFCEMLRGGEAHYLVFEDELTAAFLDHRPVFSGHCLLIPKEHFETLVDLPQRLLEPLFGNAQRLARAVEGGMQADGTLVLMNNRVSQSVPHLHIHVVPRRKGDGLRGFLWPRQQYPDEETALHVRDAIRAAFRQSEK
jgi:histidine triad (HIT) family protein